MRLRCRPMTESGDRTIDAVVMQALRSSSTRLYTVNDIDSNTGLHPALIEDALRYLIPDQVRVSGIRNRAGRELYAPSERTPSTRELRVTHNNRVVRGVARLYYLRIKGIRTCDL